MNKIEQMSRTERVRLAKKVLKRMSGDQRRKFCSEHPEICALLEGKTSSCSTSCGPQSKELFQLTEKLTVLANELRRYGAAMNRERREELRYELVRLDLLELSARTEAEAVA